MNTIKLQNAKTDVQILSDQEMSEVKGGSLQWLAALITVAYATHDLAGKAGTAYGESVTCTSGGTICTPTCAPTDPPFTTNGYGQRGKKGAPWDRRGQGRGPIWS